jgi:hypothetical protein
MLCCIIAAGLIARFLVNWGELKKYIGFEPKAEENAYGWNEWCELDNYVS